MRFLALATDYDGTLAHHGRVAAETLAALRQVHESGRKLVLVTGRRLEDLLEAFPEAHVFDRVVAENGGLLYRTETREQVLLTRAADERLVEALRARQVEPLSVGRAVVATWEPQQDAALAAIKELGLELQVIFNKGAVMILPSGVNKASGLAAALLELGLSRHNVAGVGDAENDHAFLDLCECGAATANALPALKDESDHVTSAENGTGVREFVEELLGDDLRRVTSGATRRPLVLGRRGKEEVGVPVHGPGLLLAGPSGSGKSSLATALLEQLRDREYQVLVIDPEGDYGDLADAAVLGTPHRPPSVEEITNLLQRPDQTVVVNLVGLAPAERPDLFGQLLPKLLTLRAETGRPHWVQVDEAHHLLPTALQTAAQQLPQELRGFSWLTVHPDMVAPPVLRTVGAVVAVGDDAAGTLARFARAAGAEPPRSDPKPAQVESEGGAGEGDAAYWRLGEAPVRFVPVRARQQMLRHRRKYAQGELQPQDSFYFRGPDGRLNLRAQNLFLFLQIGDGVDDETWTHHLRRHDFSAWMREKVGDDDLADAVAGVEDDGDLGAAETRARVRRAVEDRYTAPA
jgi:HAD superfamily hydrolase (TIGR01484 family)